MLHQLYKRKKIFFLIKDGRYFQFAKLLVNLRYEITIPFSQDTHTHMLRACFRCRTSLRACIRSITSLRACVSHITCSFISKCRMFILVFIQTTVFPTICFVTSYSGIRMVDYILFSWSWSFITEGLKALKRIILISLQSVKNDLEENRRV